MLEIVLKIINFLVLWGFPVWTFLLVKSKFSSPLIVLMGLILVGFLNNYLFVGKQPNDDIGFMIFFILPCILIFIIYIIVWIIYKHITGGTKSWIKTENVPIIELENSKNKYRTSLWNRIALFTAYVTWILFLIFFNDYLGTLPFLPFCLMRVLFPISTYYFISGTAMLGSWGFILEVLWFIGIWLSISELVMRKNKKRMLISTCYLAIVMIIFWLFIGTFSSLRMLHAWQQEEYKTMKENKAFIAEPNIWKVRVKIFDS